MAIAATIGSPMRALTVLAVPDRPAQLSGATPGEPAQHFELVRGHRAALEVLGQEHLQDRASVNSGVWPERQLTGRGDRI